MDRIFHLIINTKKIASVENVQRNIYTLLFQIHGGNLYHMALISLRYYLLVAVTVLLYYIMPLYSRWIIILASSLCFCWFSGKAATIIILLITASAYFSAIWIERENEKKRTKLAISISVVLFLCILVYVKLGLFLHFSHKFFIIPIGLSYFTLSILGYLLDVYWKREKAERNYLYFLTFILYFPKLLQGPISSHKYLGKQLIEGHPFNYQKICFGTQLMLWGIFKKIVIADRMSILVSAVYDNLENCVQYGALLFVAILFSALQLYCDFSGYTDMAIGVSEMLGIKIERNFNHPFFSRYASEFWQRWHMTLSGWFKDYLFFPVSRSKPVRELSKKMGNYWGPVARKKTLVIVSTSVVWIATGLWHGTGINYLLWGIYWDVMIISSELLSDFFGRISTRLHLNTTAPLWRLVQMVRTGLIFAFGRMISSSGNLGDVKTIMYGILCNMNISDIRYIDDFFGLTRLDLAIIVSGLLLFLFVSIVQERGYGVRESIARWYAVPRWTLYTLSITVVLLLGIYGYGYDTSSFAYQFF